MLEDMPLLNLPHAEDEVYLQHNGKVVLVRVSWTDPVNRLVALVGHSGSYSWDHLGRQQDELRAVYELGEEVVD